MLNYHTQSAPDILAIEVNACVGYSFSVTGLLRNMQAEVIFRAEQFYPDEISNMMYLDMDAKTEGYVSHSVSWLAKFTAEVQVQFAEIDPYQLHVEKVILNDNNAINAVYFE